MVGLLSYRNQVATDVIYVRGITGITENEINSRVGIPTLDERTIRLS